LVLEKERKLGGRMKPRKTKKGYKFLPEFRPSYIDVIVDPGEREMKGCSRRLEIMHIQYDGSGKMRIICRDYK